MVIAPAASLQMLIASRLGLDVAVARQEEIAESCLRAREALGLSLEGYLQRLAAAPDEHADWRRLVRTLTVGETYFFRDRACFDSLERQVLPSIVARRRGDGERWLNVWSAGCATGEEAYSVAILLDGLLPDRSRWRVSILATDVNRDSLDAARTGVYREWALRDTPPAIRERYFRRSGRRGFELDPEIRAMVTFAPLNLATDPYPPAGDDRPGMDVILCRNVLMYFTPEARRATACRLARALGHAGWLAVSAAEASADLLDPLAPVKFADATFYRNVTAPTARARGPAPPPRAEARESTPTASVIDRARTLADRGRLDDALELCRAAVARDPCDVAAQLLLATIADAAGETETASSALRCALYLDRDCVTAHFLLGNLRMRLGEGARARRSLETVLHLLGRVAEHSEIPGADGLRADRLARAARESLARAGMPRA